ncbi:DMT family transporter [Dielma fastidiosa]|uniref:Drug/metabolite transporter (DMT)-like permease n=1 Tax=Dielma fastidiosa TaxID=1034346 RepID=A0A318KTP6_9FIRM|nr:DMT family transporter [Dielma fastidiosa]PXX80999.1 drug/metabolite transporter (DMT)-like permease [Dielma fastidiosa]
MSDQAKGHLFAFITILIWGTTFISTKVLLVYFTPIEILFIRFLIGICTLWLVCPQKLKLVDSRQEYTFAAAGLCGITLYYLLENIALTYTQAANVGVIISIAPFFTVIFSCLFLHDQRPGLRFFLGFLIAMAGIALISFSNAALELNPMGDLLAVAAACIWAAYSTLTKKISSFGYNTIQTTRRTFFYGLIFMLPIIFFTGFQMDLKSLIDPQNLFNLLFLGLGASALCFVTWNSAVKTLGPIRTSVYIYMVPVITTAAAALILHEKITWQMLAGILLTLLGLFLSEKHKKEN